LLSTIPFFTPETKQSSTHPHVTLNSSLLLLKRGVPFDTHFNFSDHINTIITRASSFPYQHSKSPCWYQLGSAKGTLPYHVRHTHRISENLKINDPETPNYPKLSPPRSHRMRENDFHRVCYFVIIHNEYSHQSVLFCYYAQWIQPQSVNSLLCTVLFRFYAQWTQFTDYVNSLKHSMGICRSSRKCQEISNHRCYYSEQHCKYDL